MKDNPEWIKTILSELNKEEQDAPQSETNEDNSDS